MLHTLQKLNTHELEGPDMKLVFVQVPMDKLFFSWQYFYTAQIKTVVRISCSSRRRLIMLLFISFDWEVFAHIKLGMISHRRTSSYRDCFCASSDKNTHFIVFVIFFIACMYRMASLMPKAKNISKGWPLDIEHGSYLCEPIAPTTSCRSRQEHLGKKGNNNLCSLLPQIISKL